MVFNVFQKHSTSIFVAVCIFTDFFVYNLQKKSTEIENAMRGLLCLIILIDVQ